MNVKLSLKTACLIFNNYKLILVINIDLDIKVVCDYMSCTNHVSVSISK